MLLPSYSVNRLDLPVPRKRSGMNRADFLLSDQTLVSNISFTPRSADFEGRYSSRRLRLTFKVRVPENRNDQGLRLQL